MADRYSAIIEALREAPTDPTAAHPGYKLFAPGGVSWAELADMMEGLLHGVPAEEFEPEYEYSYSHRAKMAQVGAESAAGNDDSVDSPSKWWATLEEAEAAKNADHTWKLPTFIIARTKAGTVFSLKTEED
jgi:hypothetical protein